MGSLPLVVAAVGSRAPSLGFSAPLLWTGRLSPWPPSSASGNRHLEGGLWDKLEAGPACPRSAPGPTRHDGSVAEGTRSDGTAGEGDPPPVVSELRRGLDALAAQYGDLVTVTHVFDADQQFDPDSEDSWGDHGWITLLEPTVRGASIKVYFDGIDRDLVVEVGDFGWFEWFDLDDTSRVVSDVTGLCSGVMSGDAWEWRTPKERGCDVLAPDGRRWHANDGRPPATIWPRWGLRPLPRRKLPGYRPGH